MRSGSAEGDELLPGIARDNMSVRYTLRQRSDRGSHRAVARRDDWSRREVGSHLQARFAWTLTAQVLFLVSISEAKFSSPY
jgi:hypothetical protein